MLICDRLRFGANPVNTLEAIGSKNTFLSGGRESEVEIANFRQIDRRKDKFHTFLEHTIKLGYAKSVEITYNSFPACSSL